MRQFLCPLFFCFLLYPLFASNEVGNNSRKVVSTVDKVGMINIEVLPITALDTLRDSKTSTIVKTSAGTNDDVTFSVDNSNIIYTVTGTNTVAVTGWYWYNQSFNGEIDIPKSVTYLGVDYSITSIKNGAFTNISSVLTKINIPSTVTTIENASFAGCSNLTAISVDSNNPYYSSSEGVLFYKNQSTLCCYPAGKNITTYSVPSSVLSISDYAFYQAINLSSIIIPSSVTNIGEAAFYECYGLTSEKIPSSVKNIGKFAFGQCFKLDSISLPPAITSIKDYTFSQCSKLKSVIVPESVISIGDYAFSACDSLASISIPSSVMFISKTALVNTRWYNNQPDGLVYAGKLAYKYKWTSTHCGTVNINLMDGTTGISDEAFSDFCGLANITLPSSVKYIGDKAFYNCEYLGAINIPSSLDSIGDFAFYSSGLTSVNIPSSVISIGNRAFDWCYSTTAITVDNNNPNYSSLNGVLFNKDQTVLIQYPAGNSTSSYTLPSSVTSINSYAFADSRLTSVSLSSSMDRINDYAFYYCLKLEKLSIFNSTTSIGDHAFDYCVRLSAVSFGNSVKNIGKYAFSDCISLKNITIPNSVISIGLGAFYGCGNLSLPASVKNISHQFLNGNFTVDSSNPNFSSQDGILFNKDKTNLFECPLSITGKYSIPESVKSIRDSAFYSTHVSNVIFNNPSTIIGKLSFAASVNLDSISGSISIIGEQAFNNCPKLTCVSFSNNTLSTIKTGAFAYCAELKSFSIPSSVTSIERLAFQDCTGLTSIYAYPTTPIDLSENFDDNVFYDVDHKSCVLHVPSGSKSLYQVADQWKDFYNIVEDISSGINNISSSSISIFPNPATDHFTVSGLETESLLTIVDLSGKIVMQQSVSPEEQISIASLSKGIYIVKVNDKTVKLIVK